MYHILKPLIQQILKNEKLLLKKNFPNLYDNKIMKLVNNIPKEKCSYHRYKWVFTKKMKKKNKSKTCYS